MYQNLAQAWKPKMKVLARLLSQIDTSQCSNLVKCSRNVPWSGSENWRKSIDCFHKWTSCIKWWYNFGPGRRWFVIMFYKVVQLWQRDYAHSVCRLDFTLQDRGSRFNKQRVVDAATSFRGVKLKFYKKSSILARLSDTFEVEVF